MWDWRYLGFKLGFAHLWDLLDWENRRCQSSCAGEVDGAVSAASWRQGSASQGEMQRIGFPPIGFPRRRVRCAWDEAPLLPVCTES